MTLSDKRRVQGTLQASILLFNTPARLIRFCVSFNRRDGESLSSAETANMAKSVIIGFAVGGGGCRGNVQ